MRTRVGYAGGTSAEPTYSDIGDHCESVQIDFDPERISFEELLAVFWARDSSCGSVGEQYRSAVFFHDEAQRAAALATRERLEPAHESSPETTVEPIGTFTRAEGRHQKYRLRRSRQLMAEFAAMYPTLSDFVDSTAATRANAYLAGHRAPAQLTQDLNLLGLSSEGRTALAERTRVSFANNAECGTTR